LAAFIKSILNHRGPQRGIVATKEENLPRITPIPQIEKRRTKREKNLNSSTQERITVKINYEKREKGRGDGRRLSCRCARWARLIGKAANSRDHF
jgi:hypothetical protein